MTYLKSITEYNVKLLMRKMIAHFSLFVNSKSTQFTMLTWISIQISLDLVTCKLDRAEP